MLMQRICSLAILKLVAGEYYEVSIASRAYNDSTCTTQIEPNGIKDAVAAAEGSVLTSCIMEPKPDGSLFMLSIYDLDIDLCASIYNYDCQQRDWGYELYTSVECETVTSLTCDTNLPDCYSKFDAACPSGQFKRGLQDYYVCGEASCSASDCCQATCSSFEGECSAGRERKEGTDICTSCSEDECCYSTCQTYDAVCPANTIKREDTEYSCRMDVCSALDCCMQNGVNGTVVSCDSFEACGAKTRIWDHSRTELCTGNNYTECTADDCCKATCGIVACPEGSSPLPGEVSCAGDACTAQECCSVPTESCGTFSGVCPAGTERYTWPKECAGSCTPDDCCQATCALQTTVTTCPMERELRGPGDHTPCGGVECTEDDCCIVSCKEFDGTCEDGKRINPDSQCWDGACTADTCCSEDDRCSVHHQTKTCAVGEFSPEGSCLAEWNDSGQIVGWNCDEGCCSHPLQEHCSSEDAQECSKCSRFGPCLNSVDPSCISQDALDCLHCAVKDLVKCASCSVGWDVNCIGKSEHKEEGCTDKPEYQIPMKYDGTCYSPPHGDGWYTVVDFVAGTYRGECTSDTCAMDSCKEAANLEDMVESYDEASVEALLQFGCKGEDGDDEWELVSGVFDLTAPPNKCPDAAPCGPDPCEYGTDPQCVAFVVYGEEDQCSDDATVADGAFQAFAIADNTCREDGSGRSFYKLTYTGGTSGVGLIGCSDDRCTVGCSTVSMTSNKCTTPNWSNGLQLVLLANPDDFGGQCSDDLAGGCSAGQTVYIGKQCATTGCTQTQCCFEPQIVSVAAQATFSKALTDTEQTEVGDEYGASVAAAAGVPLESVTVTVTEKTSRRRLLAAVSYDLKADIVVDEATATNLESVSDTIQSQVVESFAASEAVQNANGGEALDTSTFIVAAVESVESDPVTEPPVVFSDSGAAQASGLLAVLATTACLFL